MTCTNGACPRPTEPGKRTCARCRERALARYHENYRELNLAAVCRRNGITVADYERMLAEQGGVCRICRQPETALGNTQRGGERVVKRLAIDHCHDTGRVRGLLCNNCNRAIGMLKDDPAILRAAAEYLDGFA